MNILNFKSSLLVFALSLGLLSCGDNFLEKRPDTALEESEFLSTPAQAQEILNAAYKALADGNFMGGQNWLLADLTSDDVVGHEPNGDWAAHFSRTTDLFLGTTRSLMHSGGKVIGRVNYLLTNFDKVMDFQKQIKAA
jgi:hypothetical protein